MYIQQSLLALAVTWSLAIAAPEPFHGGLNRNPARNAKPPTLPVNGGARELAGPPPNLSLKYIALGLGIQNYTCATKGATAGSNTALAVLYDVTEHYPGQSWKSDPQAIWNNLTISADHYHRIPLNLDRHLPNRIPASGPGASQTKPFYKHQRPLKLWNGRYEEEFPFLGRHFFDSNSVPNFVLDDGKIHVLAKKLDAIPPPTTADPGCGGTGAIAWLQLGDAGGSKGATYVYRVVTTGGVTHGCSSGAGGDSVKYAAFYWFFG